jgi:uncharacterized protein YjbJ (UPF0337 family)
MSMEDPRIDGAGRQALGGLQAGVGRLTGDEETRWKGEAKRLHGKLESTIGRGADAVDGWLDQAPPQLRDQGRKVLAEARKRPVVTTAALGVLALMLVRGGTRRR